MTEYLSFLRASLPWADLISVDGAVLEQIARHAAAVTARNAVGRVDSGGYFPIVRAVSARK